MHAIATQEFRLILALSVHILTHPLIVQLFCNTCRTVLKHTTHT
jgi:hypothetical protein